MRLPSYLKLMAKTIADFVIGVKRQARYGNPAVLNDSITSDIIRSMNFNKDKIARYWIWDWLLLKFDLLVVAVTNEYTLDVLVSKIIAIDAGVGDYLVRTSLKEYLRKLKGYAGTNDSGKPSNFIGIGRDAVTGAKMIRLWPTPTAGATLEVWGTKRFPDWTVADISVNTTFAPMPDDIVDVLFDLVMSDAYELQNMQNEAIAKRAVAKGTLKTLVQDDQAEPADDDTTPPTDFMVGKQRRRNAGQVV